MPSYRYRAIPFIGKIKSRESADVVSKQLQAVINDFAQRDWEFYQLSEVNIEVAPGCLAGLLGAKASYVGFDQIIFRKERGT